MAGALPVPIANETVFCHHQRQSAVNEHFTGHSLTNVPNLGQGHFKTEAGGGKAACFFTGDKMKNLFDSHTHINDAYFSKGNNRRELIREIEKSDIAYAMDIGCDLETSMMAVNHAKEHPWCYAVVGYHPHEAKDMGDME